jgi:hypothetical protein
LLSVNNALEHSRSRLLQLRVSEHRIPVDKFPDAGTPTVCLALPPPACLLEYFGRGTPFQCKVPDAGSIYYGVCYHLQRNIQTFSGIWFLHTYVSFKCCGFYCTCTRAVRSYRLPQQSTAHFLGRRSTLCLIRDVKFLVGRSAHCHVIVIGFKISQVFFPNAATRDGVFCDKYDYQQRLYGDK